MQKDYWQKSITCSNFLVIPKRRMNWALPIDVTTTTYYYRYNSPSAQAMKSCLWSLTTCRQMTTWPKISLSAGKASVKLHVPHRHYEKYSRQNRRAQASSMPGTAQKCSCSTLPAASDAKVATGARPHFYTSLTYVHVAAEVCTTEVDDDYSPREIPQSEWTGLSLQHSKKVLRISDSRCSSHSSVLRRQRWLEFVFQWLNEDESKISSSHKPGGPLQIKADATSRQACEASLLMTRTTPVLNTAFSSQLRQSTLSLIFNIPHRVYLLSNERVSWQTTAVF